MILFRIEDDNGVGAYKGPFNELAYDAQRYSGWGYEASRTSHPGPYSDEGLRPHWNKILDDNRESLYIFGFASMQSLEDWWPRENWHKFSLYNELRGTTLGISEYMAYDFHIGDRQAVFLKSDSELTSRFVFSDLTCVTP